MLVKTQLRFLFFAFFLITIIFTTCNGPMGMGDPIDWEAPKLEIDPITNPLYVKQWTDFIEFTGTKLTGRATDNVGVDRITFINTATGDELFPVIREGDKWSIKLKFVLEINDNDDDKDVYKVTNGDKIIGEIRAYDKMNNSDEKSVAIVTMIIDIQPPVVENVTIQRTDTRIARLESLNALKALETTDPFGEKKDELYRYQNGWFTISGVVNEDETKIEYISLDFYDVSDLSNTSKSNTLLLSLPVDKDYTYYFPRWSIREEDLINAGKTKWGDSYKTNYYDGKERYYYRVVIKAIDSSGNIVDEEKGCLCMFAKSDEPKGIFDTAIAPNGTVARGTPLPVDFFDDDSLLWAYTGLLTEEQWYGGEPIYPNTWIPAGSNDDKLAWLKDYLLGGGIVYNWIYIKHPIDTPEQIKELIQYKGDGKSLDEKLVYVTTGKGEYDYGDYVLFTLAADRKLAPHTSKGPEWTNTNIWAGKVYTVSVIDENAPLIVFDTSTKDDLGNPKLYCPEENTFPVLTDGKFFNIVGYTLRENATGNNKVAKFRMAWIPYHMPDLNLPNTPKGADGYIKMVQTALSNDFAGMPAGVQYWDFTEDGGPGTGKGKFEDRGDEWIETSVFKMQTFVKKMCVLGNVDGDKDDIKPTTSNFMYDYRNADGSLGKDGILDLENETKLFVFYAIDTMGHEVFRQLRLLSNKTPPDLAVYDVSNYLDNSLFSGMPDPNDLAYVTNNSFDGSKYYPDLRTYNAGKYSMIKGVIGTTIDGVQIPSQLDRTIPFQIYPRGTIVKYWINAENSGDIAVDTISMRDITYSSEGEVVGSAYNTSLRDLTFCEFYPDVTQRTFLFIAKDKLGNEARIQRTVAVTNAAKLENITTTSQSGTYGIGQKIILQANFSSQVYILGRPPVLNIRYANSSGSPIYVTIPCTNSPMPDSSTNSTSILEFEFTVPLNSGGKIETLYDVGTFAPPSGNKRPIILPEGTRIMDSNRNDSAFIPGYQNESVTMPNWASEKNSLQEKKDINLDGVRPRITSVTVGGKDRVGGNYYFKSGETLELTLNADEDIRASGTPYLFYLLSRKTGMTLDENSTRFRYQRPSGQDALVFSLSVNDMPDKVNNISALDGKFNNFSLPIASGIVDNADNAVEPTSVEGLQLLIKPTPVPEIYIKRSIPAAPEAQLTGIYSLDIGGTPTNTILYNVNPYLSISDSKAEWYDLEDIKEYSLDGGLSWVTFPDVKTEWTSLVDGRVTIKNGSWDLRIRYKDRAGNEGNQTRQLIHVNKDFPKLVSITAVQPNSTYKQGDKLEFHLEFAEPVRTTAGNNASIIISNRKVIDENTTAGSVPKSYEVVLYATATVQTPEPVYSTTIKFEWTLNGKEMPDGLYVSKIDLAGNTVGNNYNVGALQDRFGNYGVNSTSATTTNITLPTSTSTYTCPNLNGAGFIIDCITPKLDTYLPIIGGVSTDNKTIKITFNEPVMIGTGKITVRPYGNYSIPAVLENNGSTNNGTYIAGFYDIYNSGLIDNADRQTLTMSSDAGNPSMGKLALDERTGQSAGPYIKLTHGLKQGAGFTGDYLSSNANSRVPEGTTYLVPDTSTKWVLDYRYSIDNQNNTQYANTSNVLTTPSITVVPNIRAVLTKAHWRWQEIDIVSSVSIAGDEKTVTITLNEPLLNGLQWGLGFPEGAFTDKAGNKAAALGTYSDGNVDTTTNSPYWFWSSGVQAPVIRVNRKSFDARTTDWANNMGRNYSVPDDLGGPGGWGIGDFNTVHYRIESETPGATLLYATDEGEQSTGGSITIPEDWTGAVITGSTRNWDNPIQVNGTNTGSNGDWVLRNLVRRAGSGTERSYTVTENGFVTTRTITANYAGYRSYNRDVTKATMDGKTLLAFTGPAGQGQGSFSYEPRQASKNYIVATAQITHGATTYTSDKSYEGVFRSIIALKQDTFAANLNGANRNNNPIMVEGSNVKNGMPSISGFPVYDAGESGDNRFVKLFYYESFDGTAAAMTNGRLYWVSTEIVSQWYFLGCGYNRTTNTNTGGTHSQNGDVNNYLYSGYGDLSYAYNLR